MDKDKSVVEVTIDKHQSLRIIIKGAEGFPVEGSYDDVVLLIAQGAMQEANLRKYKVGSVAQCDQKAYSNGSALGAASILNSRY